MMATVAVAVIRVPIKVPAAVTVKVSVSSKTVSFMIDIGKQVGGCGGTLKVCVDVMFNAMKSIPAWKKGTVMV